VEKYPYPVDNSCGKPPIRGQKGEFSTGCGKLSTGFPQLFPQALVQSRIEDRELSTGWPPLYYYY
jgi:hypothetical protein